MQAVKHGADRRWRRRSARALEITLGRRRMAALELGAPRRYALKVVLGRGESICRGANLGPRVLCDSGSNPVRVGIPGVGGKRGHCLAVPSGGNADEMDDRASAAAGAPQAQHLEQPATATFWVIAVAPATAKTAVPIKASAKIIRRSVMYGTSLHAAVAIRQYYRRVCCATRAPVKCAAEISQEWHFDHFLLSRSIHCLTAATRIA